VAPEHFHVEQIFSSFTLNTFSSLTLGAIFTTYAVQLPALFDSSLHTSGEKKSFTLPKKYNYKIKTDFL
jgi:hypothetical protein